MLRCESGTWRRVGDAVPGASDARDRPVTSFALDQRSSRARRQPAARRTTPIIAALLVSIGISLLVSGCKAAAPPSATGAAAEVPTTQRAPNTTSKPRSALPPIPTPSTGTTPAQTATPAAMESAHDASAAPSSNDLPPDINVTRASYGECIKAAGGVTPDMKRCMGEEYAYQDNRLNTAYKALIASMDTAQRRTLRSEERAWIAYRKSHCKLDPSGGQAAELDAFDCSVQATARQAAALQHQLTELESRP